LEQKQKWKQHDNEIHISMVVVLPCVVTSADAVCDINNVALLPIS